MFLEITQIAETLFSMYLTFFTEKVQEVKKNFLQESGIQFSELEEKVLQFHLSNLEYACGSTLNQVNCSDVYPSNLFFDGSKYTGLLLHHFFLYYFIIIISVVAPGAVCRIYCHPSLRQRYDTLQGPSHMIEHSSTQDCLPALVRIVSW